MPPTAPAAPVAPGLLRLIGRYKSLADIERGFRVLKSADCA
jgi:hypothetical protein